MAYRWSFSDSWILAERALVYVAEVLEEVSVDGNDPFSEYWRRAENDIYKWEHAVDKLVAEASIFILLVHRAFSYIGGRYERQMRRVICLSDYPSGKWIGAGHVRLFMEGRLAMMTCCHYPSFAAHLIRRR